MQNIPRHPAVKILEGIQPAELDATVYRCVLHLWDLEDKLAVSEWLLYNPKCRGWTYDAERWTFHPPEAQIIWGSVACISGREFRNARDIEGLIRIKVTKAVSALEEIIRSVERGQDDRTLSDLAKFYRLAEIKSRHKPKHPPRRNRHLETNDESTSVQPT